MSDRRERVAWTAQAQLALNEALEYIAPGLAGAQSKAQSRQVLTALTGGAHSASTLAEEIGLRSKTEALKRTLGELVADGLVEYTFHGKPTSRLQRYRITTKGREFLKRSKARRR